MTNVAQALEEMKSRFDADAACGMDLVFQFNIEDNTPFSLIIKDGNYDIVPGESDCPDVTLSMDAQTLVGVLTGEVGGIQAFMSGQLRTKGDTMLALKLGDLFPS